MRKVKRPENLIRYASLNSIETNKKFSITPRIIGYSMLFLILGTLMFYLIFVRTEYNINILRTPGMLFLEQPDGTVSNVYDLNIVNKTFSKMPITLHLDNPKGKINFLGDKLILQPQGSFDGKFIITLDKNKLDKMSVPVEVSVYSEDKLLGKMRSSFMGPLKEQP